jgi:hypothetical protein
MSAAPPLSKHLLRFLFYAFFGYVAERDSLDTLLLFLPKKRHEKILLQARMKNTFRILQQAKSREGTTCAS